MTTDHERAKTLLFHCNLRIAKLRDELEVVQDALRKATTLQRELMQKLNEGGDHVSLAD